MDNLLVAADGSASAWASARLFELGYVGTVRLVVDVKHQGSVRHQCIRFRDTREQALEDARSDARKLVEMWSEGRVPFDGE